MTCLWHTAESSSRHWRQLRVVKLLQKNVEQYFAMVSELEKLLPLSASRQDSHAQHQGADDLLRAIPAAIQNMSDLFKYASARIAFLHDRIETAREKRVKRLRQASLS